MFNKKKNEEKKMKKEKEIQLLKFEKRIKIIIDLIFIFEFMKEVAFNFYC